jgi:YD repeat-containing protein
VLSLTGPNNLTTNWTHDKFGRKSSETRADGTATSWFYERCVDLPAGTCPPPEGTSYAGEYRVKVTAAGGPTTSTYYDRLNREIRGETEGFDGTLVRKDTRYDPLGRVAQVSRPYFAGSSPAWTVFQHDALGRTYQVDEPSVNGVSARTVTEFYGLVTKVTVSNAGSGAGMPEGATQIRETTRNSQGQVIRVTQQQQ